ncbi:MAG: YciI family protein [Anaerolineae bacterium]|nr:YciI family protein [Anaerolineae bacterium]
MQYTILIYEAQSDFAARLDSNQGPGYWGAYKAYGDALAASGILVGGGALQADHTATTVRLRDGNRQVQDGPYADTKEQLGGYFVIDVSDLDTALEWAARCPGASTGVIEVRPLVPMPE